MAMFASWSPGIAFMPAEFPGNTNQVNGLWGTEVVGLRQSGGATFHGKAGTDNWFHVPISTPVIIAGTRAKLTQVWVMFNCGDLMATIANNAGANITDIHVWDGANRIQKFGGFKLFGKHNHNLVDTNVLHKLPAPIDIFFGVEIAVHVSFSQDQTVTFFSAGADFDA